MFQGLSERLQGVLSRLRGKGKLSEADVNEASREIRLALLEADVSFRVVKDFIGRVKERAVGSEVLGSLTPGQQVVKIVHEELTALLGGSQAKLTTAPKPPTVYLMAGLQGAGKTTHTGKLALYLKKQGRRPLLVACDIYRPAAVKQLQIVGEQAGVPVHVPEPGQQPPDIAKAGVAAAVQKNCDVVLVDTAGRLQIDDEMMAELEAVKAAVEPTEILLVIDAMTGQEAVNVAEAFHSRLGIDGVILTKLDSDTRGGAALSVRAVTGRPIKFTGTGEKLEALEPFHPDRMAQRILGMGDVLTLIEKAQETFDAEQAAKLQEKLRKQEFNFDDFLEQLQQVRKMGPLEQVMGMIPGLGNKLKDLQGLQPGEQELSRVEAMVRAMTRAERQRPDLLMRGRDASSRRRRIARGSGVRVQEVNQLLKQFEESRKMMKQLATMQQGRGRGLRLPFGQF